MGRNNVPGRNQKWLTLAEFPVPAKTLVSVVILTMAIAMVGALGQIFVVLFSCILLMSLSISSSF